MTGTKKQKNKVNNERKKKEEKIKDNQGPCPAAINQGHNPVTGNQHRRRTSPSPIRFASGEATGLTRGLTRRLRSPSASRATTGGSGGRGGGASGGRGGGKSGRGWGGARGGRGGGGLVRREGLRLGLEGRGRGRRGLPHSNRPLTGARIPTANQSMIQQPRRRNLRRRSVTPIRRRRHGSFSSGASTAGEDQPINGVNLARKRRSKGKGRGGWPWKSR